MYVLVPRDGEFFADIGEADCCEADSHFLFLEEVGAFLTELFDDELEAVDGRLGFGFLGVHWVMNLKI